jgi:DNA-directed RNA polymerase sigma subunit (sigma70/sigma32)
MKIKNKTEFLSDLKQMSVKEVISKYHLCATSVYRYKQRYGLNVHFSDNVPADFTEYAKTHNKLQAKEHYNTSYAIIRKWERLANCKCVYIRHRGMIERNLKIRELCRTNTYSAVGKLFGITKQRVAQIINKE